MNKATKFVHYVGLILFLGSIFTFGLISTLTKNTSLENLVFARQVISTGTDYLTLPGLFLLIIAGLVIAPKYYHLPKHWWLNGKHILMLLIIINTIVFILPAEKRALELAIESSAQGRLLSQYSEVYIKESIAGGVNVLLTFGSMIIAIFRMEKDPKN